MLEIIAAFLIFLCWGSFLNVVGFRLIREQSLLGRSACASCKTQLAWYDLMPLISWIALKGRCRTCHTKISLLYPAIELLTAVVGTALILFIEPQYWFGYFLFFSALIVTIRTDAETMLISRYMTLGMIPIAFLLIFLHQLPIGPIESILGMCFGYSILWIIGRLFHAVRNIEGIGQGDLDLLAMIGAYTGILGAWMALFIGALFGSCMGLILVLKTKRSDIKFAFGPWLALGAIIYVFMQEFFINLF